MKPVLPSWGPRVERPGEQALPAGEAEWLRQSIQDTLEPLLAAAPAATGGIAAATLTTSSGSRVPASAGAEHIVASICRMHAARLSRPQWLRACGRFAAMHAACACTCAAPIGPESEACGAACCVCCGLRVFMLAALWKNVQVCPILCLACMCARHNRPPDGTATVQGGVEEHHNAVALSGPQPCVRTHFESVLEALSLTLSHCPFALLLEMTQACGAVDHTAQATAVRPLPLTRTAGRRLRLPPTPRVGWDTSACMGLRVCLSVERRRAGWLSRCRVLVWLRVAPSAHACRRPLVPLSTTRGCVNHTGSGSQARGARGVKTASRWTSSSGTRSCPCSACPALPSCSRCCAPQALAAARHARRRLCLRPRSRGGHDTGSPLRRSRHSRRPRPTSQRWG